MRSLLSCFVLAVALVAGCSSGGSNDAGGPVELTFWTWATNIEKVVDKWNATHPDVHVCRPSSATTWPPT